MAAKREHRTMHKPTIVKQDVLVPCVSKPGAHHLVCSLLQSSGSHVERRANPQITLACLDPASPAHNGELADAIVDSCAFTRVRQAAVERSA